MCAASQAVNECIELTALAGGKPGIFRRFFAALRGRCLTRRGKAGGIELLQFGGLPLGVRAKSGFFGKRVAQALHLGIYRRLGGLQLVYSSFKSFTE